MTVASGRPVQGDREVEQRRVVLLLVHRRVRHRECRRRRAFLNGILLHGILLHGVIFNRIIPSRIVVSRIVLDRVILSRIVPSRIVPSRIVPSRIVPSRIVLDRVILGRVILGRVILGRVILYRVILYRVILYRIFLNRRIRRAGHGHRGRRRQLTVVPDADGALGIAVRRLRQRDDDLAVAAGFDADFPALVPPRLQAPRPGHPAVRYRERRVAQRLVAQPRHLLAERQFEGERRGPVVGRRRQVAERRGQRRAGHRRRDRRRAPVPRG